MRTQTSLKLAAVIGTALILANPLPTWAAAVVLPADLGSWTTDGVSGSTDADGDITDSTQFSNGRFGYVTTAGSSANGNALTPAPQSGESNGSRIRSAAFSADAADTLTVAFNYISTDGKKFTDYGWARLINANDNAANAATVAWLFTARSGNSNTGKIVPGLTGTGFDPDLTIDSFNTFDFNDRGIDDPVDFSPLGASNRTCYEDANGCGYTGWLLSRYSFAAAGSYRLEVGVINFGDQLFDSALAFDFQGLTPAAASPAASGAQAGANALPEPTTAWLLLAAGLAGMGARRRARHG